MRTYYKNEIAAMAGVSTKTLQRWMARNREKLISLGCRPTDKMIYPKALEWICQEYCIDVE